MTVIYLSCLFNHAVLWIEQSLWERRRLPGVKLVCWHRSRGCAVRSRLFAFAPYGLNKLRFIRVSRKEEFPETSHFPSSASNLFLSLTRHLVWLCCPTRGGLAWAAARQGLCARHKQPPREPGRRPGLSLQAIAAKIASCPQFRDFAGLSPAWPLTSFPPFTDSFSFIRIYDLILFFFSSLSKVQLKLH